MTYKVATWRSRKGVKMTMSRADCRPSLQNDAVYRSDQERHHRLSAALEEEAGQGAWRSNRNWSDKYPKDAKCGRLSSRRMTKVKYLVKGWKEPAWDIHLEAPANGNPTTFPGTFSWRPSKQSTRCRQDSVCPGYTRCSRSCSSGPEYVGVRRQGRSDANERAYFFYFFLLKLSTAMGEGT